MRILVDQDVLVATMPVGAFQMNEYFIACKKTGKAALIDAGGDPAPFIAFAEEQGLEIVAIWQTHAHIDHVAGLADSHAALPDAEIVAHKAGQAMWQMAPMTGQMYGIPCPPLPTPTRFVEDGEVLELGESRWKVIFTPGHAPGHVVFYEATAALLLCGDLIFRGSIGRTDLPLCDGKAMQESLLRMVQEIPDTVTLFPGHMGISTMGREKQANPFLEPLSHAT